MVKKRKWLKKRNDTSKIIQSLARKWLQKRKNASKIIQSLIRGWTTRKYTGPKIIYNIGYNKLNTYQKDIFNECLQRKSGGLSLPMGSGKTLIALILALHNVKETGLPILILCSKSLIASWEFEIRKFFGEELKYEYVHKGNLKDKMEEWNVTGGARQKQVPTVEG